MGYVVVLNILSKDFTHSFISIRDQPLPYISKLFYRYPTLYRTYIIASTTGSRKKGRNQKRTLLEGDNGDEQDLIMVICIIFCELCTGQQSPFMLALLRLLFRIKGLTPIKRRFCRDTNLMTSHNGTASPQKGVDEYIWNLFIPQLEYQQSAATQANRSYSILFLVMTTIHPIVRYRITQVWVPGWCFTVVRSVLEPA